MMDCLIEESETEELEECNEPVNHKTRNNRKVCIDTEESEIDEEEDSIYEESDNTDLDEERAASLHANEIVTLEGSESEEEKNISKGVRIEELHEEDILVEEIQSDLPLEDIRIEELKEALIKDVEKNALRDKLNEMHNNLIELQIENAKLKFERDGYKEDMESYRKRLINTLQETKQLLQESYLLEEGNAFLKKTKIDLETERKLTHQEMIEKMLLAKKATRNSSDMEMALQHLSRAYENQRIIARKTIDKINDSESVIKKMQSQWDDLVVAVEEKCREVEEKKKLELSKRRHNTQMAVNHLLHSMENMNLSNVKVSKLKTKEKKGRSRPYK